MKNKIIPKKPLKIQIFEENKINEIQDFFANFGFHYNKSYIRNNFDIAYAKFLQIKYFSDKDFKNDEKKI